MPESLLTILKFFFLALLYLFFVRVVRAVWAEVSPPKAVTAMDADAIGTERTSVRRATIYRGWQPRSLGTSTEERRPYGVPANGVRDRHHGPVAFPGSCLFTGVSGSGREW